MHGVAHPVGGKVRTEEDVFRSVVEEERLLLTAAIPQAVAGGDDQDGLASELGGEGELGQTVPPGGCLGHLAVDLNG